MGECYRAKGMYFCVRQLVGIIQWSLLDINQNSERQTNLER